MAHYKLTCMGKAIYLILTNKLRRSKFRLYLVYLDNGMKLSTSVKSISYLKANAAEIIQDFSNNNQPLVITQNGEAKAVLQDIKSYEETQDCLMMLKLLALSSESMHAGKVKSVKSAFMSIRKKIKNKE